MNPLFSFPRNPLSHRSIGSSTHRDGARAGERSDGVLDGREARALPKLHGSLLRPHNAPKRRQLKLLHHALLSAPRPLSPRHIRIHLGFETKLSLPPHRKAPCTLRYVIAASPRILATVIIVALGF